jgi:hypothetical protein
MEEGRSPTGIDHANIVLPPMTVFRLVPIGRTERAEGEET